MSVAQMKLIPSEVEIPAFVKEYFAEVKGGITRSSIEDVNLWYYKGDRVSTWHYDGHDNFLFMISGKKTVYLAPPNTIDLSSLR